MRAALLELLGGRDRLPRFAAAFVLFHGERPSLRLLAPLLDSLELDDGDARWQATHMLAMLGRLHPEVLPVLLHEVTDGAQPLRRRMALFAARELAPERPETAHACARALDDADGHVRRAALTCFAKLAEPALADVDRVIEIARHSPDPRMRRIAAVILPSLVQSCPERSEAIAQTLAELAHDTDASLARAARRGTPEAGA